MASKVPTVPLAQLPGVLKETVLGIVRHEGRDLTARQLAILLICYLDPAQAQTVRALAAQLKMSGPAVSRSLDRLSEFDLVRRMSDPTDRRSVLIGRTRAGSAYVAMVREVMADAAKGP
jgi:DNA-binding MarR family transcriptional regulator